MAKTVKRRRTGAADTGSTAHAATAPRAGSARSGATGADLLSEYGLIGACGLGVLLLALVLAPVIGGVPAGYGFVEPYYLRLLVCLAALLLPALTLPRGRTQAIALAGIAAAAIWTGVSLKLHSRLLTDPTLLAAMLPATLDWLCFALIFLLAMRLSPDRRALLLITGALLAGAAWVAFSGVQEYGMERAAGRPEHRVMGTFFAPNFTAGFLGLALPLAIAVFLRARSLIAIVALGALSALMTGTLAATGSRQGIAAAAAGLAVALLLALWSRVRLPWARIAALLIAMAVMLFLFRGPLTSRVAGATAGQAHSGQFRTETWKGSLAMATAHPVLGTGPGTFEYRYPPYSRVARTNLAHSSYLQTVAEQGFPALIAAVLAIGAALLAGLLPLRRPAADAAGDADSNARHTLDTDDLRLLRCAVLGGLIAGVLRGFFDSEWSVLGNALPFWALAGLAAGTPRAAVPQVQAPTALPTPSSLQTPTPLPPPSQAKEGEKEEPTGSGKGAVVLNAVTRIAAGMGLLLTLLLLFPARALDNARAMERVDPAVARASAETAARGWPPNAEARALLGRMSDGEETLRLYREAALLEPSGMRWYQLARQYERSGNYTEAIRAYETALRAEPGSLQTLRALAEAREKTGDAVGAMRTWQRLIEVQEGPVGQIRAIPELVETHAVHAYAARGEAARGRGEQEAAAADFAKAADLIEAYAQMPPIYAQMEVQQSGAGVTRRLTELRALYETLMERLIAAAGADEAKSLRERRERTLQVLDDRLKETSELLGTAGNAAPAGGNP